MKRFITVALLAGACGPTIGGQIDSGNNADADKDGPVITHDGITEPQPYGQDIYVEAVVVDEESGVFVVELNYQAETSATWQTKAMLEVGNDLFQGRIEGDDVLSGGMRYFIRATDDNENESCLPEDCDEDPWYFSVVH